MHWIFTKCLQTPSFVAFLLKLQWISVSAVHVYYCPCTV